MFNSKTGDSKSSGGLPLGIVKGTLFGVLSAAVLAFIFTFAALMTEDPDKLLGGLAYTALFIGALVSGIVSPKSDVNPTFSSAMSGGGYALVVWLASMPYRAGGEPGISPVISLLLYLGCIAVSAVGGLIFRRRSPKLASLRKSPAAAVRKQLGRR